MRRPFWAAEGCFGLQQPLRFRKFQAQKTTGHRQKEGEANEARIRIVVRRLEPTKPLQTDKQQIASIPIGRTDDAGFYRLLNENTKSNTPKLFRTRCYDHRYDCVGDKETKSTFTSIKPATTASSSITIT